MCTSTRLVQPPAKRILCSDYASLLTGYLYVPLGRAALSLKVVVSSFCTDDSYSNCLVDIMYANGGGAAHDSSASIIDYVIINNLDYVIINTKYAYTHNIMHRGA